MNKKEILKKYKEKIKLINKFNKFYYDKSDPIISDQDYDSFKKEILQLENKFSFKIYYITYKILFNLQNFKNLLIKSQCYL